MAATTWTLEHLSGSTDGEPISLTGSATTVHTATSDSSQKDQIYLYCYNVDQNNEDFLTVEFGSQYMPAVLIPAGGGVMVVCDPITLGGGVVVDAYCTNSDVRIFGHVHRQTTE